MERTVNAKIIKYILREIMVNNSVESFNDTKLQQAADVILEIALFIEQVSNETFLLVNRRRNIENFLCFVFF